VNSMAENNSTGEPISPSNRPKPRPRLPSDKPPPPLPPKQSLCSERELEMRLGIVKSSVPVTHPSTPLPSPPELPLKQGTPETSPRLDEHTEGVSAASVKDSDAVQLGDSCFYMNVDKSCLYVNAEMLANDSLPTSAAAQIVPSSTEPVTSSPDKPGLVDQAGEIQMRSDLHQVPASAKTSGKESHKVSRMSTAARVSQFTIAAEKAAKPEIQPPAQKVGRVVVPTGLEEKIATSLARKPAMQTVVEMEGEVIKPSVSSIEKKPSRGRHHDDGLDGSDDTKCMLLCKVFFC